MRGVWWCNGNDRREETLVYSKVRLPSDYYYYFYYYSYSTLAVMLYCTVLVLILNGSYPSLFPFLRARVGLQKGGLLVQECGTLHERAIKVVLMYYSFIKGTFSSLFPLLRAPSGPQAAISGGGSLAPHVDKFFMVRDLECTVLSSTELHCIVRGQILLGAGGRCTLGGISLQEPHSMKDFDSRKVSCTVLY